jgi:hypothetical protein
MNRREFKAPTFDGSGDVDYFIRQFAEVAEANEWAMPAAVIHLRASLTSRAADCGQAGTLDGIFTALRVRFGVTTREAKARLMSVKREYRTTLQEHAAEVTRLVNLAYADLPVGYREQMCLDTFSGTLNHGPLQRHLLAVNAPTLQGALQAGTEFMQIRGGSTGANIHTIDGAAPAYLKGDTLEDTEEEPSKVAPVATQPMDTLLQAILKLTEEVQKLKKPAQPGNQPRRATRTCFGCKKEGHFRRDCPTHPWPARNQGNDSSPQQ